MTYLEQAAKSQIIKKLREQGYATYARLFNLFDLQLTDNPDVIGYMIPGKAKIVINKNLNINQVSTIIRHEILHEYLSHGLRAQAYNAAHPKMLPSHKLANIAADFEISNKGYTEADKNIARAIMIGEDKVLQALVTEDEYPGWENMTFEEMYEKLLEESKEEREFLKKLLDKLQEISQKLPEDAEDQSQSGNGRGEEQQDSDQSDGKDGSGKDSAGQGEESEDSGKSSQSSSTSGRSKETGESGKRSPKEDKLQGEIEQANKDKEKIDGTQQDGTPLMTPQEQKAAEELAERVVRIKGEIEAAGKDIESENATAIEKERVANEIRKLARIQSSGINQFRLSLNRVIRDEVEDVEERSFTSMHAGYEDSGFIIPGRREVERENVPSINVYWDVSGSFSDPAKTAGARSAIATLQQYEKRGQIKMRTYYHADRVSDTVRGAGAGNNGQELLNHIKATKPRNVVIISDDNIDYGLSGETVVVPGAVWMLFYETVADDFIRHLSGKKLTKVYEIDY